MDHIISTQKPKELYCHLSDCINQCRLSYHHYCSTFLWGNLLIAVQLTVVIADRELHCEFRSYQLVSVALYTVHGSSLTDVCWSRCVSGATGRPHCCEHIDGVTRPTWGGTSVKCAAGRSCTAVTSSSTGPFTRASAPSPAARAARPSRHRRPSTPTRSTDLTQR